MKDTFGILKKNKENDSHFEFLNTLHEIDFNVKFLFETEADLTLSRHTHNNGEKRNFTNHGIPKKIKQWTHYQPVFKPRPHNLERSV